MGEEEEEEEKGEEEEEEAQEEEAEEVRQGHLQAGDALRRPVEGHRHQRQDHPRPGVQGALGLLKKKGINKGRSVGKIDGLWNGGSMFKMTAAVSKPTK